MPGNVVRVTRQERVGWLDRFYLSTLVEVMRVSGRHFLHNLRGWVTGRDATRVLTRFPEERVPRPPASRGMPVLVEAMPGRPRCTACGDCAVKCPVDCIRVAPDRSELGNESELPEIFDIDMALCTWCGLCEEICPEEAIVMSSAVEIAAYDRDSMVFHKNELLVPADLVAERLEFIRSCRRHTTPRLSTD